MEVKQARRGSSAPGVGACRSAEAVAGAAQLACVLEASAEKPGNITPRHDFADTSYEDMLRSAIALGPELGRAAERGVGDTVLAAVRATRRVAGANTNLGIALLLAPLARAALLGGTLRRRAEEVLDALTLDDARAAYAAIRMAGAGGLDEPVEHDVRAAPTIALRDAMASRGRPRLGRRRVRDRLCRDLRARAPGAGGARSTTGWARAPRRSSCSWPCSRRSRTRSSRASAVVAPPSACRPARPRSWPPAASAATRGRRPCEAFDASLRRDGNALNPGTTADLVTAVLFVALLDGLL